MGINKSRSPPLFAPAVFAESDEFPLFFFVAISFWSLASSWLFDTLSNDWEDSYELLASTASSSPHPSAPSVSTKFNVCRELYIDLGRCCGRMSRWILAWVGEETNERPHVRGTWIENDDTHDMMVAAMTTGRVAEGCIFFLVIAGVEVWSEPVSGW